MSLFEDIGDVVGVVAPTIATALGGPLAGIATRFIAKQLLGDEAATPEAISQFFNTAGPSELIRLKELETEFQSEMKRAGVRLEELAVQDRASARDRQIRMKDWTPTVLAIAVVGGFFVILALVIRSDISQSPIVTALLGALTAMTVQVGNYYFGSSAGSARKNETIEKLRSI